MKTQSTSLHLYLTFGQASTRHQLQNNYGEIFNKGLMTQSAKFLSKVPTVFQHQTQTEPAFLTSIRWMPTLLNKIKCNK